MQEAKNKAEEDVKVEISPTVDTEEPLPSTKQPDDTTPTKPTIKTEISSPGPLADVNVPSTRASPQQEHSRPESQPNTTYSSHASPDALNFAFNTTSVNSASYGTTQCQDFSSMMTVPCATSDPTAMSVSAPMNCSVEGGADGIGAFSYPYMMFPGSTDEVTSFETQLPMKREMLMAYQDVEATQPAIETGFHDVASEQMNQQGFRIKSPPAVDLAGRRKRPGLALSGLRSSSNGPTTGMDFGGARRVDPGSPMRRVASASGFGPQGIRRFPAQQRQFSDRRQESLLQAARSPNVMASSLNSAMAPPTPSTPVVATQQSLREATVSSNSSSDDNGPFLVYSEVSTHPSALDQSLRTPPATPVTIGDTFTHSIEATLGFAPSDEALLTPGVEFPMRSTEFCLPNYVSDGYMSQPSTPSFPPPQMSMSTAYYASMPSGNTEFNWTDATMVSKSSPHQNHRRQLQFNNFTAQDFNGGK